MPIYSACKKTIKMLVLNERNLKTRLSNYLRISHLFIAGDYSNKLEYLAKNVFLNTILKRTIQWSGVLFFLIMQVSCQKEYEKTNALDENEVITSQDTLVSYVLRVVQKDGSFDDMIDDCSEISIQFPYSIKIRNEYFDIESLTDLKAVINDYYQYKNNLTIDYPIVIEYSDYSLDTIENRGELNKVQKLYKEDSDGVGITKIDFEYPVTVNGYNTLYQISSTVIISKDKDMYNVFHTIGEKILALDFPVSVIDSEGEVSTVNSNSEMKKVIESVLE